MFSAKRHMLWHVSMAVYDPSNICTLMESSVEVTHEIKFLAACFYPCNGTCLIGHTALARVIKYLPMLEQQIYVHALRANPDMPPSKKKCVSGLWCDIVFNPRRLFYILP